MYNTLFTTSWCILNTKKQRSSSGSSSNGNRIDKSKKKTITSEYESKSEEPGHHMLRDRDLCEIV